MRGQCQLHGQRPKWVVRQVRDRSRLVRLNAANDRASAELTLMQARVEFLMNRLRPAAAAKPPRRLNSV
jgi:hypothetical protein